MRLRTHYFVGLGVSAALTVLLVRAEYWALGWVLVAVPMGLVALLPDILDEFPCSCTTPGVRLKHCRHPTTHHPMTALYALPLFLLGVLPGLDFLAFFLTIQVAVVWESHILIDMLNPSGVPIGFRAVFANVPSRDYLWKQYDQRARTLRIGKLHYDDPLANGIMVTAGVGLWIIAAVYQGVGTLATIAMLSVGGTAP
jgi:hypothetical protein